MKEPTETTRTARLRLPLSVLLLLPLAVVSGAGSGLLLGKSKPLTWKTIDSALLRINGEAPKDWSVAQSGRKNDPLLIELGDRFLLVQVHEHKVFEIDPATIKHQPEDELLWSLSDRPAQPVPSEWTTEDLGSAFRLAFTLPKQSMAFDLQIPHPPDVGDLPAHSSAPATGSRRRY